MLIVPRRLATSGTRSEPYRYFEWVIGLQQLLGSRRDEFSEPLPLDKARENDEVCNFSGHSD